VSRTNASLERVADDERRASGVPLGAKGRPGQLLAVGEAAVELGARLCDCHGVSWAAAAAAATTAVYTRRGM